MTGRNHFHVKAQLVLDVALEGAASEQQTKATEHARDGSGLHDALAQAYRSTRPTASVKRVQLSVSIASCFFPSAVSW